MGPRLIQSVKLDGEGEQEGIEMVTRDYRSSRQLSYKQQNTINGSNQFHVWINLFVISTNPLNLPH